MPSVQLIASVPSFVSSEEHKNLVAATPSSFTDIPPVVRHIEKDVSISLDPAVEGFSPEDCAVGTLYVLERYVSQLFLLLKFLISAPSVLVFVSSTGRGFQIQYPSITLHAVSRTEAGPSIYCQLDESSESNEAPVGEDYVADMRELTIVPKNAEACKHAMSPPCISN
jgi:chloride channel, nucleotide-sensitive, 1A